MKIVDAFTFFDELELLEMRLRELAPVVDAFVLVESDTSFAGHRKPLVFHEHRERFAEYPIEYVCVRDMPGGDDAWAREHFQRDAIARGLGALAPDDIVMISDVDEIPRRESVAHLRDLHRDITFFQMRLSYFAFNYVRKGEPQGGLLYTTAVHADRARTESPSELRESRRPYHRKGYEDDGGTRFLRDAGWHLSYFGDEERIRGKIRNFSHQEHNTEELLASLNLEEITSSRRDIFGREKFHWEVVPSVTDLPDAVRRDPGKYGHFFVSA